MIDRVPTRAVVFDLDGTLIESAGDISDALNAALIDEGLGGLDEHAVRGMIGAGARVLVERALSEVGGRDDEARVRRLVDRFEGHYLKLGAGRSKIFPGGLELLRRLRKTGASLGICTNKPDEITQMVVRDIGLLDYVDVVVGVRPNLRRKPAPDMLLQVCDALGCTPAEALMVGDSSIDVETARAAGVPVVVVSFGYSQVAPATLGADAVVDDLLDVQKFFVG